ncbi:hypothetical protein [Streptomyces shenzhenensis]|uniref:hypothetical protein n=1 Tax=Streptomyces shenzhenensis TaxID=943815 RepID=UPI0033DD1C69
MPTRPHGFTSPAVRLFGAPSSAISYSGEYPCAEVLVVRNADGAGGADLCIGPGAVTGLVEKAAASTADR